MRCDRFIREMRENIAGNITRELGKTMPFGSYE